eukprot:1867798-Rhodomonas_salina.1
MTDLFWCQPPIVLRACYAVPRTGIGYARYAATPLRNLRLETASLAQNVLRMRLLVCDFGVRNLQVGHSYGGAVITQVRLPMDSLWTDLHGAAIAIT